MIREIYKTVLTVSAIFWLSAPVAAQSNMDAEYEEILKSDKASNWATAFQRYKALAEKGHAKSQYQVGYKYWWGFGVTKSRSEARRWYVKAANNGNSNAALTLGQMYEKGDSVPKSPSEEFSWFLKAAELGQASAMAHIGGMYFRGDTVPKSLTSAAYWFKKSNDAGNSVGQTTFKYMQEKHPEAVRNMSRGSTRLANRSLAVASAKSPVPERKPQLVPERKPQLVPASDGFSAFEKGQYARARQILLPHANRGNGDAQNVMGILYLDALGVMKNNKTAVNWFQKAANRGHAGGLYHLGYMIYYQHAPGGIDPFGKAKSLLERSAKQNFPPARKLLATMQEDDRLRRVREKREFDESINDIQLGRCRNPRYVTVNGKQKVLCD